MSAVQAAHAEDAVLRFGRFELHHAHRRLLVDGAPVVLGGRAFDLLAALAARAGRLVGKSELINLVWPGLVVEEANLTVQISALRRVVGNDTIVTVPGRGYRFVMPTKAVAPSARPAEMPADDMTARREIRFTTSSDGVQIATARYGSGPLVLKAATWLTHIDQVVAGSVQHALIEEFSATGSYVEYDTRGCGLSQRRVDDISFEAWVRDLEAVANAHGGDEPFTLLGFTCGAGVAIEYAARHPERVRSLVLLGGFATSYFSTSHPDPAIRREGELMIELAAVGWGNSSPAFRQVFVSRFLPDASPAQWSAFDKLQRETCSPDVAASYLEALYGINVKEAARRVRCPALMLHPKGDQMVPFEQGRRLASLVPGARFVPLEGRNHIPLATEPAFTAFMREVRSFLGEEPPQESPAPQLTARQTEALRHIARGASDKQIAAALSLSPRTVEMHVASALKALGCRTRAEAVHRATQLRLLRIQTP
jgi:pimeloyl-ACP methyl ester carboxylesterase/DNA-binding CsgD family transcriptional regulator